MIGAILKQLVRRGDIPREIRELFREAKEFGGRRLQLAEMSQLLRETLASLPQVFICIHALDECRQNLHELLEPLRDIVCESTKTRIFLTGSPYVNEYIQRYFPKVVMIPASRRLDISHYLYMKLEEDYEPDVMSGDLRADILRIIPETMSNSCVGTFGLSTLSMMYTYQLLSADFSLLR